MYGYMPFLAGGSNPKSSPPFVYAVDCIWGKRLSPDTEKPSRSLMGAEDGVKEDDIVVDNEVDSLVRW